MLTLKNYYSNKQKYSFFDRLIDIEEGQKELKLHNMGISYSTYRGNKANNVLTSEMFEILLKHFKVKNVEDNKNDKYELCINKIYYNSLYKCSEALKSYLDEIQLYIEDNNYLKPIFVLFKVLGYMNYTYTYDELVKILSKDIEYLLLFKKLYFVDDYELIYLSIMHYFKQVLNYSNLYSMVEKPNKYRWIYFQTTATLEYLNFNDYEALIYYDKALKEFEEYNILERKLHVINNISLIYNNLHKYDFSLSYSKKVIEYVFSDCESKWISYILQNYLYSLYILNKNEEIKIFYKSLLSDFSKVNSTSAVIMLLVLYGEDLTLYNELYKNFKQDNNVTIINEYLINKDIMILESLSPTQTLHDLCEYLKKQKH